MRHELHEFGPFTIELHEEPSDTGMVWTRLTIAHGRTLIRRCRELMSLEEMKRDAKRWLFSATARWQSQAADWDETQTSTRP